MRQERRGLPPVTGMEASSLSAIQQALKNLQYGYVQLTVHEGQVVRIERVERIRFSSMGKREGQPEQTEADRNLAS